MTAQNPDTLPGLDWKITCKQVTSNRLDRKRIDRLYSLLERAEREGDTDMAATLRWAIFTLENR